MRGITYLLAAASIPLYINFFENPLINFPLKVEVLDERTGGPLEHAEIYVQDTRYRFETGPDGIGQETARVRKKREQVVLTCTAEGYVTQEKLIDVPETRAPRPELYTLFVLTPSDLR